MKFFLLKSWRAMFAETISIGPQCTKALLSWGIILLLNFIAPTLVMGAARVAIMPVEDLSKGDNGYNPAITSRLYKRLAAKGVTLVAEQEMIAFMVRNRVRTLGQINSLQLMVLGRETGADYLLLSTVTQQRQEKLPALALTLRLVQVKDGLLVWSDAINDSQADEKHLFGVAEPDSLAAIEALVLDQVVARWPEVVEPLPSPVSPDVFLDFVKISPAIILPKVTVSCCLKLSSADLPRPEKITLLVNKQTIIAHYRPTENDYFATWSAPAGDGRYPVYLGSSPQGHAGNRLLGSFVVDSVPPKLALQLKGAEYNSETYLQRKVLILPRHRGFEAISRWRLVVYDGSDEEILSSQGQGPLPGHLTWWGQQRDGTFVADGSYRAVLEAWDQAGNKGQISKSFQVMRTAPVVQLALQKKQQTVAVDLTYQGELPLEQWQLELRTKGGELLAEKSGMGPYESFLVDLGASSGGFLCHFTGRDVVGNQINKSTTMMIHPQKKTPKKDDPALFAQAGEAKAKIVLSEVWKEDF